MIPFEQCKAPFIRRQRPHLYPSLLSRKVHSPVGCKIHLKPTLSRILAAFMHRRLGYVWMEMHPRLHCALLSASGEPEVSATGCDIKGMTNHLAIVAPAPRSWDWPCLTAVFRATAIVCTRRACRKWAAIEEHGVENVGDCAKRQRAFLNQLLIISGRMPS